MLASLGYALLISCAPWIDAAHAAGLPAYSFGSGLVPQIAEPLGTSASINLLSYFTGNCLDSQDETSLLVRKLINSPFMAEKPSVTVVVKNFNLDQSESSFGSPNFYLHEDFATSVEHGATRRSVSNIGESFKKDDAATNRILLVDAQEKGIDRNSDLFNVLQSKINDYRILLVGIPGDVPRLSGGTIAKVDGYRPVARNDEKLPYIKIPEFFESEENCAAMTNNCSGRGSCLKSSAGRYACRCDSTVKDGYTYYWGGVDCSKRDVSYQFFLLAGTTLTIIAACAMAIQFLFTLGKEPLPGILDTSAL